MVDVGQVSVKAIGTPPQIFPFTTSVLIIISLSLHHTLEYLANDISMSTIGDVGLW